MSLGHSPSKQLEISSPPASARPLRAGPCAPVAGWGNATKDGGVFNGKIMRKPWKNPVKIPTPNMEVYSWTNY